MRPQQPCGVKIMAIERTLPEQSQQLATIAAQHHPPRANTIAAPATAAISMDKFKFNSKTGNYSRYAINKNKLNQMVVLAGACFIIATFPMDVHKGKEDCSQDNNHICQRVGG